MTQVAALFILRTTSSGFQAVPSKLHTYAFLSAPDVTILSDSGAQSMLRTLDECSVSVCNFVQLDPDFLKIITSLELGDRAISVLYDVAEDDNMKINFYLCN